MDQQDQSPSLFEMEVDSGAQAQLLTISRWIRYIAILVFVCIGLVILVMVGNAGALSRGFSELYGAQQNQATAVIAIVVIAMVLLGVWFFFLFRASQLIKRGLYNKNSTDLAEGFKALKIYFIISVIVSALSLLGTFSEMAG